jgi:hypothetical protein
MTSKLERCPVCGRSSQIQFLNITLYVAPRTYVGSLQIVVRYLESSSGLRRGELYFDQTLADRSVPFLSMARPRANRMQLPLTLKPLKSANRPPRQRPCAPKDATSDTKTNDQQPVRSLAQVIDRPWQGLRTRTSIPLSFLLFPFT